MVEETRLRGLLFLYDIYLPSKAGYEKLVDDADYILFGSNHFPVSPLPQKTFLLMYA